MITINAKFSQEMQSLGLIGRVGENASRQIVFDCSEVLNEFSVLYLVFRISFENFAEESRISARYFKRVKRGNEQW